MDTQVNHQMDERLEHRLAQLLDVLASVPGVAEKFAASGELELRAARLLIECGALDEATRVLDSAETLPAERGALWLLVAKSWARRTTPDDVARVEHALRKAAALAPVSASPALAQFLERQRRFPEAIEAWRDAVRLAPHESGPYLGLARVYERVGRAEDGFAFGGHLPDAGSATGCARHELAGASAQPDGQNRARRQCYP
jgi:Flp pilus assembly protein TadD